MTKLNLKPLYGLQLAFAVMIVVETTPYGLGEYWLSLGLIVFTIVFIFNVVLEFVNNIKWLLQR